jgi:uncharacterized membrane protein YfcA
MESKNLSELSEKDLENKAKLSKNSLYFSAAIGLICTLVVVISAYISKQPLRWHNFLFTTLFPIYMLFQAKKQLDEVKTEFERRRYN